MTQRREVVSGDQWSRADRAQIIQLIDRETGVAGGTGKRSVHDGTSYLRCAVMPVNRLPIAVVGQAAYLATGSELARVQISVNGNRNSGEFRSDKRLQANTNSHEFCYGRKDRIRKTAGANL